jgi:magnesium transporter
MIEIYKRLSKNESLKKIDKYEKNTWINIVDPTKEEIEEITEKFKLEKEKFIDGLDINEAPRIESESEGIYIFLRIPTRKITDQSTSSFLAIATKNNLITVSRNNLEIFKLITSEKILFLTNQNARNIMKFLYLISREFDISVRKIYKEIKKDRRNLNKLTKKDLIDLVQTEDILNDYNYSFRPLVDIYKKIIKIKSLKFTEKDKEFIEDLIIDLDQTMNINLLTLKTITNMRDYFSTSVSNRLNDIITVLTVFTIFLTIPTLISSIYGMNVNLPFQHSPYVLFILLGILIFLWAVFLGVIKWRKII